MTAFDKQISQATTQRWLAGANTRAHDQVRWECPNWCYVYDPEHGDPPRGIAPGTAFEMLPRDWGCPYCGMRGSAFAGVDKPDLQQIALRGRDA